jgi:hypothetical protein
MKLAGLQGCGDGFAARFKRIVLKTESYENSIINGYADASNCRLGPNY